jgi:hypothetical protein
MNPVQQSSPHTKKTTPEAGSRPQFLSVPVWDISDEEISEWSRTPGRRFAAYTAECIRDGKYDNGQELYPHPESAVYRELTKAAIDEVIRLLAERGMVRKSGDSWHAIAPGRMEPSTGRAIAILLARRADLPPALATELESWKRALDALNAPAGPPAQAAMVRPVRSTRPAFAVAAS